jgi:hypothetical protein
VVCGFRGQLKIIESYTQPARKSRVPKSSMSLRMVQYVITDPNVHWLVQSTDHIVGISWVLLERDLLEKVHQDGARRRKLSAPRKRYVWKGLTRNSCSVPDLYMMWKGVMPSFVAGRRGRSQSSPVCQGTETGIGGVSNKRVTSKRDP